MREMKRRFLLASLLMIVSVLFCMVSVSAKPTIVEQPKDGATIPGEPITFKVVATGVKAYDWAVFDPDDLIFRWGEETLKYHCTYDSLKNDEVTIVPKDTWLNGKLITCFLAGTDGTNTRTEYAHITVNAEPSPTPTPTPTPTLTPSAPEKGTLLTDVSGIYEVTGKKSVAFKAPLSGKKVLSIPAEVTIDGFTYQVTEIADSACKGNTNLVAVEIVTGVKKIGKKAFYGCTKLTTFETGSNVKSIGAYAFYNCKKLKEITLHTKLESIGAKAFYKCKGLQKIVIKTSKLTKSSIGSKAFAEGYSKVKVNVPTAKLKTYPKILKEKGMSSKAKYY